MVLNADNARAAEAAARSAARGLSGFRSSIRCGRARGSRTATWFIAPRKEAETETDDAAERDSAQGRAQRGKRAGRGVRGAAGRRAGGARFARAIEKFQGRRASAGVCGHASTAWSSTTTPRPPMWTRRPRRLPRFPAAFISFWAARTRAPTIRRWRRCCATRVRAVYTIGSAAAKIESQLRGVVSIHSCETLDHAVNAAASAARPGEVVLLAPACSSFDQFENYEQRGRVFKELVSERRGWKAWQNA